MRIVLFCNNRVGWQVLKFLKEQGARVVGLVVHPEGECKFREEIVTASHLDNDRIFEGPDLRQPSVRNAIKALAPDLGLSVLFGYILKPDLLEVFSSGVVNLHPSLLPYNRGANPDIWSIVEGTPAGATLHYIDEGLDTGDIIAQKRVTVELVDTGQTLYRKLEMACLSVFRDSWPTICSGSVEGNAQREQDGTHHSTRDLGCIDAIDLDREYRARDLINVIRARTFKPYPGAYFMDRGRKVYMRLQLLYESQLHGEQHESID